MSTYPSVDLCVARLGIWKGVPREDAELYLTSLFQIVFRDMPTQEDVKAFMNETSQNERDD